MLVDIGGLDLLHVRACGKTLKFLYIYIMNVLKNI